MASVIYSTKMTSIDGTVKKGGVLTLVGHVKVVGWTNQKIHSLKEELVLSYNGEKMQSVVKPMLDSGDVFETKHLVTIPPQFQDGRYTITNRVLINGRDAAIQFCFSLKCLFVPPQSQSIGQVDSLLKLSDLEPCS
jgi:hypothetical protein